MTNEELVEEIQKGINVQANMEQLYCQNKGWFRKWIRPYIVRGAEADDLMQQAYFGLHKAVQKYHPVEGASFLSYLVYCVRTEVEQYCNRGHSIAITSGMKLLIKKYRQYCSEYHAEHGMLPSDSEICEELKITMKKLHQVTEVTNILTCMSIDIEVPDGDGLTYADCIPDEQNVEQMVIDAEVYEHDKVLLWELVAGLPDRQSDIILKHFRDGQTLKAIADEYGVSDSAIMGAEKRGLNNLQKRVEVQQIALDYDIHPTAWRGGLNRFRHTGTSATEEAALKHIEIESKADQYARIRSSLSLMAEKAETERFWHEITQELPDKEQGVVLMHNGLGMSYNEIAAEYGLSKARVIAIERQGLNRLSEKYEIA